MVCVMGNSFPQGQRLLIAWNSMEVRTGLIFVCSHTIGLNAGKLLQLISAAEKPHPPGLRTSE